MRNFTSAAVLFAAADAASGTSTANVATRGGKLDAAKRAEHADAIDAKRAKRKAVAKPGTTEAVANPETEAKPDPRVARAERLAAERTDIAALYASFEANRVSVPVKTLSAFKPETSTAHPIARNPSARQAAAICVALAAANAKLADGAQAARVFERNGVRVCIENGVMRDAIASGLISVSGSSPETEIITVRAKQAAVISGLIGATTLKLAKLA